MPRFLKTQLTQGVRLTGWVAHRCWRGLSGLTRFTGFALREVGGRAWQHPRTTGVVLGLVVTGTVCRFVFSDALFPETADRTPAKTDSTAQMTGMDGQLISVLPDVEPAKLETDFPMTALVPNTVTPPALPDREPIVRVASTNATPVSSNLDPQTDHVPVTTGSQFGTPPWSEPVQTIPEYRPNTAGPIVDSSSNSTAGPGAWLTGTIEPEHGSPRSTPPTQIAGPWGNPGTPHRN